MFFPILFPLFTSSAALCTHRHRHTCNATSSLTSQEHFNLMVDTTWIHIRAFVEKAGSVLLWSASLKRHFDLSEKKRQKKVKATSDWRERRNAIRLTSEYTVETLVVADADMVQYHGAEAAQRFILTVMNMVSWHFTLQRGNKSKQDVSRVGWSWLGSRNQELVWPSGTRKGFGFLVLCASSPIVLFLVNPFLNWKCKFSLRK